MKTMRSKKPSHSSKNAFVLMIGDEGGIMLHVQDKRVVKRVFAQSPAKEHVRAMDEMLKSFPRTPVTLLVDMMDQSYVRQTLPPVSSFNVGKIVRRRLNKDFSTDDIKGYLIFGREKTGRKDWNYLMASLANPPLLQQWIDFVVERPNPFRGIGLVPLECQALMQAIETAQLAKAGKDTKPTEWHILISHHKVGGFRQVVLKNGQLVFTRLAQLVGEPTPEVIAGNIEQEMLNTLEYLKRLGLQDPKALTATILASSDIRNVFDPKAIRAGQCHFYTPFELAGLLSMDDVAKPEDQFGDIMIAGFIGKRRKLLLTLFTAYTRKLARISQSISLARSAAASLLVGVLLWAGMSGFDLFTTQQTIEELSVTQKSLDAQYNTEAEKKRTLPEKIDLYTDVANMFKYFYQPEHDTLYFAHNLSKAIGDLALIKSYHWALPTTFAAPKSGEKWQITATLESTLNAPQEPRAAFVSSAQALVENIKKTFPDYEVTHSDLPGILSDNKELKTVINDSGNISTIQSDMLNTAITFTIKGPNIKDPAAQNPAGNLPLKPGR
jgi:hypothetical protein